MSRIPASLNATLPHPPQAQCVSPYGSDAFGPHRTRHDGDGHDPPERGAQWIIVKKDQEPSTKHQAPITKHQRNAKSQNSNLVICLWSFGLSLVIGLWDLEFRTSPRPLRWLLQGAFRNQFASRSCNKKNIDRQECCDFFARLKFHRVSRVIEKTLQHTHLDRASFVRL